MAADQPFSHSISADAVEPGHTKQQPRFGAAGFAAAMAIENATPTP
jgi:hypothetical protein